MKVVVEVTTDARADLVVLLAARMPVEGDAVRFAALFTEEIEQQFIEYEGPPPGSRRLTFGGTEEWWWRYTDGIWTVFRIVDRSGWLFAATRTITVFAFEPSWPVP